MINWRTVGRDLEPLTETVRVQSKVGVEPGENRTGKTKRSVEMQQKNGMINDLMLQIKTMCSAFTCRDGRGRADHSLRC